MLDLRTLASETNKHRPPPLAPNENARLESAPSEWGKEGGGIGPMKTKTFYCVAVACRGRGERGSGVKKPKVSYTTLHHPGTVR